LTNDSLDEVDYLCVATDLLQQMFTELQSLALSDPEFARAVSVRGSHARVRLLTLQETILELMGNDTPSAACVLARRACALVSSLSDEIDTLMNEMGDGCHGESSTLISSQVTGRERQ
jgi:CHASE3 domain sensor protein